MKSDFNPHNAEYNNLQGQMLTLSTRIKEISDELNWYNQTNIGELEDKQKQSILKINSVPQQIDQLGQVLNDLTDRINAVSKQIKTLFNPKNWFNKEQRAHRKDRSVIKSLRNGIQKEIKDAQSRLKTLDGELNETRAIIKRYHEFDVERTKKALDIMGGEYSTLEGRFTPIKRSKDLVDSKLAPIMEKINETQQEICAAETNIKRAEELESDLTSAPNNYNKMLIHKACESEFGEGSPGKVKWKAQKEVSRLYRDLEKLTRRAEEMGIQAARIIKTLIIDGNNMCYESGNRFVGLSPLKVAISRLRLQYKVMVVFDSSITHLLERDLEYLCRQLEVDVHIVATHKLADETILDRASVDPLIYVISNDRFGEYFDKQVVIDNRIIRHEIINGQVLIHDLDIREQY